MKFYREYTLTRYDEDDNEEKVPVQLELRADDHGEDISVVSAFDERYGCKVELTAYELGAIDMLLWEWFCEAEEGKKADAADMLYDQMRDA